MENKNDVIIGKDFVSKVVPLIARAEKNIRIIVFDWRNYSSAIGSKIFRFNQELIKAKKRGVSIEVVIHDKNKNFYWLKEHFKVKRIKTKKLLHIKLLLIDEKVAVVGSHNYTFSGLELNKEISLICYDEEILKTLTNFYKVISF